jgi:hypothetical protein
VHSGEVAEACRDGITLARNGLRLFHHSIMLVNQPGSAWHLTLPPGQGPSMEA